MSENNKILLVEDDRNFGDVLCSYLEMNDYEVTLATDGEAGLETFKKGTFDLCIFDVMMPKKDGFSLAEDVRGMDQNIPIIFLTARTMKEDIIKGFKIGADDYISKPFTSEELLYRIQAVLKRSSKTENKKQEAKEFNVGDYHFNYPLRILTYGEKEHQDKLSPKEAELLKMFCMYKNDILPRSVALKEIWGEDNYFTARSMDVFVTKLRKYLKRDENIEIVNIHGNGFQLRIKELS
ncbi:MAG: response regulator transcription factor [Saprospiraceae bacterium]|nr:response regulator transcription factor [Saprospiraceae bacterium]